MPAALICLARATPVAIAVYAILMVALTPLKCRFHAWRHARRPAVRALPEV